VVEVVVLIAVAALVLVACGTVVVVCDPAPDVLAVPDGAPDDEPVATEVVGPTAVGAPGLPGNAGPEELAAAFEREYTGR
jgi:hypothetical protein